jgi:hypothetical protein
MSPLTPLQTQSHILHLHIQETGLVTCPIRPRLPIIHLAAIRRTLAAFSTALASLFAHETTAQRCQTIVSVSPSFVPFNMTCPLTKLPDIPYPSSALAEEPVGIVPAEDRSTFAVVVVERRIVGVGRSRRLGDRSCEGVVS